MDSQTDHLNDLISGQSVLFAALSAALERSNPQFRNDLIDVLEQFLAARPKKERYTADMIPTHSLLDFLKLPERTVSSTLH